MTDRMKYCPRCGQRYDPYVDMFCGNCGITFRRTQKRSPGNCFIPTVLILVVLAVASPFIYKLLFGDCGTLHVSRAIRDLDTYAEHLTQIENATINNKRPPTYLLAQIDGDIISLNDVHDECVDDAYQAGNNSLTRASIYFGGLPSVEISDAKLIQQSYGKLMLQRKGDYENALRELYGEIGKLKVCYPFCNIDTLFDFGSSLGDER